MDARRPDRRLLIFPPMKLRTFILALALTTAAGATAAAGAWKLGALRTSTALVISTTQGIQLDVGGTLYTLAVLSTNP